MLQAALAFGVSMVELLVAIAQQPQNAGALFVQAMRDLGKTVKDILEPAFTLSDADKRYLVQSLKDAGTGLQECLDGLLEIVGGAIFTVVGVLLEIFGVFRHLTPAERARAKSVYKDTVPLDDVQLFIGSFVAWGAANNTGSPTGVTTMRIIHFPDSYSDTDPSDESWLIHELMHVWQGEHIGPVYMAHALIGQATDGLRLRRCDRARRPQGRGPGRLQPRAAGARSFRTSTPPRRPAAPRCTSTRTSPRCWPPDDHR